MEESLNGLKRTIYCGKVTEEEIGKIHTVMGWVQRARNKGSLIFIDLRDRFGIVQGVLSQEEAAPEVFEKAKSLRSEYVVALTGTVEKREGAVNEKLATGAVEIKVSDIHILSEADTPPFQISDDVQVRDEIRLKYRYLDLRRPHLTNMLAFRSRTAQAVRRFLESENFLEIETPLLIKSTPEGARDYLVPSRVHPGKFYALPQSPQMYKQLLMVSGMDRYFQFAKCLRDEDLRADRQPEFTQIDMELSFAEAEDVMDVNERLLHYVCKEVVGWDVPLPIRRMPWDEAMDNYGSDKPDLRFGMELITMNDVVADCGFGVFEDTVKNGGVVKGLVAPGLAELPRKKIDALQDVVKLYRAKGLAYICLLPDGTVKSPIAKFLSEEKIAEIKNYMKASDGDLLLFVADKRLVACNAMGQLRLELGRQLNLMDPNKHEFLWVTDFPMFEYSEEEGRYLAMHHPFTMPKEEDLPYLESEPGRVHAKAYDIVLNGVEIGGGSVRIHRKDVQDRVFKALGFSEERIQDQFGFFVKAFTFGAPPHAGLAYGFDRLIMEFTGEDDIRDVIAFPKIKNASDPMSEAPSFVSDEQLEELSLAVTKREE